MGRRRRRNKNKKKNKNKHHTGNIKFTKERKKKLKTACLFASPGLLKEMMNASELDGEDKYE